MGSVVKRIRASPGYPVLPTRGGGSKRSLPPLEGRAGWGGVPTRTISDPKNPPRVPAPDRLALIRPAAWAVFTTSSPSCRAPGADSRCRTAPGPRPTMEIRKPQHLGMVGDAVVIEAAQIFRRTSFHFPPGWYLHLVALFEAPDQIRQCATAMRGNQLQIRIEVEKPVEDHPGERERGVGDEARPTSSGRICPYPSYRCRADRSDAPAPAAPDDRSRPRSARRRDRSDRGRRYWRAP